MMIKYSHGTYHMFAFIKVLFSSDRRVLISLYIIVGLQMQQFQNWNEFSPYQRGHIQV